MVCSRGTHQPIDGQCSDVQSRLPSVAENIYLQKDSTSAIMVLAM